MILYLRARGLLRAAVAAVVAVLAAVWFADWIEAKPGYDHLARVPAVVLGALAAAVLVAPAGHRVDDEVEGSTPRPRPATELAYICGLIGSCALLAALVMPYRTLERGGAELARDVVGLAGLGLLCGALLGARLAWVLPFGWASASYLGVTRLYTEHPHLARVGWLMFPGTWAATWWVAGGLLAMGLLAFRWGGFVPLPRHHPRR